MSMYPEDKDLVVYCPECWWSSKRNGDDYAMDYDLSRPFLEQFRELIKKTPQVGLATSHTTLVNSDYVNDAAYSKDCYLIFWADYCDNVMYSSLLANDKDSADCHILEESELCYGNLNCQKCYRVFFSEDCQNCENVYFSKNCIGCSNVIGCINLRNQKYMIENTQYTREDYEQKLRELDFSSRKNIENYKKCACAFWATQPHKYMHGYQNKNVTGDYVRESKNSFDMYQVVAAEDCKHCIHISLPATKDAHDYSGWGNNAELMWDSAICGENVRNLRFCYNCFPNCSDMEYCVHTSSSHDMFGCTNIKQQQYCILNKPYSKEEFERLRAQIVEDMNAHPYVDAQGRAYLYGEFMPPDLSLFGYNESRAQDYFPITEDIAQMRGYHWYHGKVERPAPTMKREAIPDRIQEASNDILKEILECSSCGRSYKIISNELELLRRFELPVPNKCPDCRHKERWARMTPPLLWKRMCAKCGKDIQTSYAPERPEIVYCEQCFQAEVA